MPIHQRLVVVNLVCDDVTEKSREDRLTDCGSRGDDDSPSQIAEFYIQFR